MSNFGRLGSAMVNDFNSLSSNMRARDKYADGQAGRDLNDKQTEMNSMVMDADAVAAGGKAKRAQQLSEQARLMRENKMAEARIDLKMKQAKLNKINAQTAKIAMNSAAKLTKKNAPVTTNPVPSNTRANVNIGRP